MASNKSLLVLAALFAALLFISSEVSARELAEQTHEKNAKDAKEAEAGNGIEDQKRRGGYKHGGGGYGHGGYPRYPPRCPPYCPQADKIPEPENRPETEPNN